MADAMEKKADAAHFLSLLFLCEEEVITSMIVCLHKGVT